MALTKRHKVQMIIFSILCVSALILQRFVFNTLPIRYPNFGISIPGGYTTHGIDVSRYQKNIDWDAVCEMEDRGHRISFAIIKATEGLQSKDPYFDKNWRNIEKAPLIRGAYMYFHPGKNGNKQAAFFAEHVKLKKGDLAPVVDIEETNRSNTEKIKKNLQDCLLALENIYHTKPIIYTNVDFYNQILGSDFDEYPFWAAHYQQLHEPRTDRDWSIWQHSDRGHVNGIEAYVDFNVVNGSIDALKKLCLE
ncbi:MAG: GH25 family lysozyme [Chitinophagaceae bacterium]